MLLSDSSQHDFFPSFFFRFSTLWDFGVIKWKLVLNWPQLRLRLSCSFFPFLEYMSIIDAHKAQPIAHHSTWLWSMSVSKGRSKYLLRWKIISQQLDSLCILTRSKGSCFLLYERFSSLPILLHICWISDGNQCLLNKIPFHIFLRKFKSFTS